MSRSSGAIYRVDHDGYVSQLTPREFGITNTMAWTTDGRFLTADTKLNEIYAYDLCAGVLSNKRVFGPPLDRGAPDGSCLDVMGRLWNCRVAGGACIACIRPDGALDQFVDTPCPPRGRRPLRARGWRTAGPRPQRLAPDGLDGEVIFCWTSISVSKR
jgi:sugar lactone lactonase YvrE